MINLVFFFYILTDYFDEVDGEINAIKHKILTTTIYFELFLFAISKYLKHLDVRYIVNHLLLYPTDFSFSNYPHNKKEWN